jgi:hypothetical protein
VTAQKMKKKGRRMKKKKDKKMNEKISAIKDLNFFRFL